MLDRLTNETNLIDMLQDEVFALMVYFKLKKYEDLGFEPDELRRIISQNELRGKLIKSARIEVIIQQPRKKVNKATEKVKDKFRKAS